MRDVRQRGGRAEGPTVAAPTNAQGRQLAGPSCIPVKSLAFARGSTRDLQPDYFFLAAFLVDFLVAFFVAFFLAAISYLLLGYRRTIPVIAGAPTQKSK
jgi:hypothetical protein